MAVLLATDNMAYCVALYCPCVVILKIYSSVEILQMTIFEYRKIADCLDVLRLHTFCCVIFDAVFII